MVTPFNLPIAEVPQKAFQSLGSSGVIQLAHHHACTECTHPYKAEPDTVPVERVAEEENQSEESEGSRQGVEAGDRAQIQVNQENNGDRPMVNMVVVDGIVMGTTVSHSSYNIDNTK